MSATEFREGEVRSSHVFSAMAAVLSGAAWFQAPILASLTKTQGGVLIRDATMLAHPLRACTACAVFLIALASGVSSALAQTNSSASPGSAASRGKSSSAGIPETAARPPRSAYVAARAHGDVEEELYYGPGDPPPRNYGPAPRSYGPSAAPARYRRGLPRDTYHGVPSWPCGDQGDCCDACSSRSGYGGDYWNGYGDDCSDACGYGSYGRGYDDYCGDDCGISCCEPRGRWGGGWVGSAEVTFLKPHNSSGTGFNSAIDAGLFSTITGASLSFDIDPDYEASGRFTVGWQACGGLGVRGRFWDYDHAFDGTAAVDVGTALFFPTGQTMALTAGLPITIGHSWDTSVIDLEVFDTARLGCYWDVTWSAGFRYVEYREVSNLAINVTGTAVNLAQVKDFDGIGMTTALELRRPVFGCLDFFTNARWSILMGDEEDTLSASAVIGTTAPVAVTLTETQKNDVKFIFEMQVGAQYVVPLCGNGDFFVRAGAEMQYWDGFGVSPTTLLFDESAGFGGLFVAIGVNR
jgi:hypothetical protein